MENIINIEGVGFIVEDYETTRNSGGRLDKVWIRNIVTGMPYLVKTSTVLGLEPFSEAMAYNLGVALGFNVLEYKLIPSKYFKDILKIGLFCKYVTVCPNLNTGNQKLRTVTSIKNDYNGMYNNKLYNNTQVMEIVMPKEEIDKMLFFDAIIGNKDRHYRNVHVLLDYATNQVISCPLLDNGDSLLATDILGSTGAMGSYLANKYNKSFTLNKTHDKQIKYITTIDTSMYNVEERINTALFAIEPILNLMSKGRSQAVRSYLIYRIDKYYRMFGAK